MPRSHMHIIDQSYSQDILSLPPTPRHLLAPLSPNSLLLLLLLFQLAHCNCTHFIFAIYFPVRESIGLKGPSRTEQEGPWLSDQQIYLEIA